MIAGSTNRSKHLWLCVDWISTASHDFDWFRMTAEMCVESTLLTATCIFSHAKKLTNKRLNKYWYMYKSKNRLFAAWERFKKKTSFPVLLLCCLFLYTRSMYNLFFFRIHFVGRNFRFHNGAFHFILFSVSILLTMFFQTEFHFAESCITLDCRALNVARPFFEFQNQFRIFVSLYIRYQTVLWIEIYVFYDDRFSFYAICYILFSRTVPRNNVRNTMNVAAGKQWSYAGHADGKIPSSYIFSILSNSLDRNSRS